MQIDYRLADELIIELVAQFNSATLVELEDGKRTLLSKTDPNQRQAIAKRLLTPSTHLKASVNPCKKVQWLVYVKILITSTSQFTVIWTAKEIIIIIDWQCVKRSSQRKQPIFCNATTGFPAKWHLRYECGIPYWWPWSLPSSGYISSVFWLVILHGKSGNKKHYPDLGSDTSSVWNFSTFFSDVLSQGNQCWHCEMLAVFSG